MPEALASYFWLLQVTTLRAFTRAGRSSTLPVPRLLLRCGRCVNASALARTGPHGRCAALPNWPYLESSAAPAAPRARRQRRRSASEGRAAHAGPQPRDSTHQDGSSARQHRARSESLIPDRSQLAAASRHVNAAASWTTPEASPRPSSYDGDHLVHDDVNGEVIRKLPHSLRPGNYGSPPDGVKSVCDRDRRRYSDRST